MNSFGVGVHREYKSKGPVDKSHLLRALPRRCSMVWSVSTEESAVLKHYDCDFSTCHSHDIRNGKRGVGMGWGGGVGLWLKPGFS